MSREARHFGKRLAALRRRTGKSQLEVAQELKAAYPGMAISQTNVSYLERRDHAPRSHILEILADYFGVSIEYFLSVTDDNYETRKPSVASHIAHLREGAQLADGFLLHTDDNSSGDAGVLKTTDNIHKFYRSTDASSDNYDE